jgi:hypothetical protein
MMEGESLHEAQRRRYWRYLAIVGIGAAPMGFGMGWAAGRSDGDLNAFWDLAPDWLVIGLLGIAVATICYGTWRFYRSIDEVELQDNLWASSISYGAYALLFPGWWILSKTGMVGEPNDWLIFVVALGAGLAGYLGRKWRAH